MKLLITGGAGFVGARLARTLLARGTLQGRQIEQLVLADQFAPEATRDPDARQVLAQAWDLSGTRQVLLHGSGSEEIALQASSRRWRADRLTAMSPLSAPPWSTTRAIWAPVSLLHSGGTAWAPRKVVRIVTERASPRRRAARWPPSCARRCATRRKRAPPSRC